MPQSPERWSLKNKPSKKSKPPERRSLKSKPSKKSKLQKKTNHNLSSVHLFFLHSALGRLQFIPGQHSSNPYKTSTVSWERSLIFPYSSPISLAHSVVSNFLILWAVAHCGSFAHEISRQEYWSGLPFPTPDDLPDPQIEPCLLSLLHCRQIFYC